MNSAAIKKMKFCIKIHKTDNINKGKTNVQNYCF